MKILKRIIHATSNSPNMRGGSRVPPSYSSLIWNSKDEGSDIPNKSFSTSTRSGSTSIPSNFHQSSSCSEATPVSVTNENSNWQDIRCSVSYSSADSSSSSCRDDYDDGDDSVMARTTTQGPLLLLTGDPYHITCDGTARTLYRFKSCANVPLAVEECYRLKDAKKSFLLRQETNQWDHHDHDNTMTRKNRCYSSSYRHQDDGGTLSLGTSLRRVHLQELDYGLHGNAGTGGTTWESSILMSMYFAAFPQYLLGDVVELGSGVGLGGMLCTMTPSLLGPRSGDHTISQTTESPMKSFTFTDYNPTVLEQCRENLKELDPSSSLTSYVYVSKLDWYDFLSANLERRLFDCQQYDTIIACDCAYRQEDILALAATIQSLLRNPQSQAHIFGPYNRTGMEELLTLLRNRLGMSVTTERLEMERIRLSPVYGDIDSIWNGAVEDCPYISRFSSSFLHIMCSLQIGTTESDSKNHLSDMD